MNRFTESPLFTKTYDFLLWLYEETLRFPKSQRFTLSQQLQNEGLEFLKCIISARSDINKAINLKIADVHLQTLRIMLRLSKDMTFLSFGKYENGIKQLEEIGRLIGDWQKRAKISDKKM